MLKVFFLNFFTTFLVRTNLEKNLKFYGKQVQNILHNHDAALSQLTIFLMALICKREKSVKNNKSQ